MTLQILYSTVIGFDFFQKGRVSVISIVVNGVPKFLNIKASVKLFLFFKLNEKTSITYIEYTKYSTV